jgi:hypothetical protein
MNADVRSRGVFLAWQVWRHWVNSVWALWLESISGRTS